MVPWRPRRLSVCALGASWVLAAACDAFDGTDEAPAVVVEAGLDDAASVEAGGPPGDAAAEAGATGCSSAGGCTVLFAGEDEPTELVRRGSVLYWVRAGASGAFVRGLVDGGTSSPEGGAPNGEVDPGSPLDGLRGLRYVGANAGNPFAVAKDGLLYRGFPRSSCAGPGPISFVDGLGGGVPLVASAGSSLHAGTCGVWSALVPDAGATVSALRGEGQTVFWATQNGDVRTCTHPCAGDAGTTRLLAEEKGPVLALALDTDRVYWVVGGRISFLRKAAAPDEKPTTLATGQGTIRALVVGSSTVYWTTDQGMLMSASVNPLTVPTVLVEGLDQPWGLELDPDAVYVAERGQGRILRVARR